jgi:hypothetical protein
MTQDEEPFPELAELLAQAPAGARVFGSETPSGFARMSNDRFWVLALWGLPADFLRSIAPLSFWSADEERLLAMIFAAKDFSDFGATLIARDKEGRYRPLAHKTGLPTRRAAEDAIQGKMGVSALTSEAEFKPLNDQPPGIDLFEDFGVADLHPAFVYLRDGVTQTAARELLGELAKWTPDLDGNLVRDLQTTGYSARVWELYLRFAFRAIGLDIAHTYAAPDFWLRRGAAEVFVEAVTVNAPDPMSAALGSGPPPDPPADFWAFIEKDMPIKFGSPLHTKMQKRYWEQAHVAGKPFALAIADFHAPGSMVWSHTAVSIYLYGRSALVDVDEKGRKKGTEKLVAEFDKGGVTIVPFFDQPETEHVSAVIFSNAGTISKFNRMGVRAGFGDRFVRVMRRGGWHNPDPGAFDAIPFELDIESPHYSEAWEDELEMYHNPKAQHPIDEALFPTIAHFRIENGEAMWRGPEQRVLFSRTTTLDLLGRKPPVGV